MRSWATRGGAAAAAAAAVTPLHLPPPPACGPAEPSGRSTTSAATGRHTAGTMGRGKRDQAAEDSRPSAGSDSGDEGEGDASGYATHECGLCHGPVDVESDEFIAGVRRGGKAPLLRTRCGGAGDTGWAVHLLSSRRTYALLLQPHPPLLLPHPPLGRRVHALQEDPPAHTLCARIPGEGAQERVQRGRVSCLNHSPTAPSALPCTPLSRRTAPCRAAPVSHLPTQHPPPPAPSPHLPQLRLPVADRHPGRQRRAAPGPCRPQRSHAQVELPAPLLRVPR